MAISAGLTGVLRADANLRDFELTKDGNVKERSALGKLFARIGDHFGRKTSAGRKAINHRNRAVGDAMLRMVQSRTNAQVDALYKRPEAKTMSSEDLTRQRDVIYNSAKSLSKKITLLRNCKEMPPEILEKVKKLGPDTLGFLNNMSDQYVKGKTVNLLTCDIDTTLFALGIGDTFKANKGEDFTNIFMADAGRGMVSCPAVPNSQNNPEAIKDYIGRITHNIPVVKNFLINACNQNGFPFAIVNTLMGNITMRQANLPSYRECLDNGIGFGNLNDRKHPNNITLTTRKDGSIDARANFYLRAITPEGESLAGFKVSMNLHLPVDEAGYFSILRGEPNYRMEDVSITNMPLR